MTIGLVFAISVKHLFVKKTSNKIFGTNGKTTILKGT